MLHTPRNGIAYRFFSKPKIKFTCDFFESLHLDRSFVSMPYTQKALRISRIIKSWNRGSSLIETGARGTADGAFFFVSDLSKKVWVCLAYAKFQCQTGRLSQEIPRKHPCSGPFGRYDLLRGEGSEKGPVFMLVVDLVTSGKMEKSRSKSVGKLAVDLLDLA